MVAYLADSFVKYMLHLKILRHVTVRDETNTSVILVLSKTVNNSLEKSCQHCRPAPRLGTTLVNEKFYTTRSAGSKYRVTEIIGLGYFDGLHVSEDIRVRIPQKLDVVAFWSWNLDVVVFQS